MRKVYFLHSLVAYEKGTSLRRAAKFTRSEECNDILAKPTKLARWALLAIDELKTHLNGRKTPIRSLKPREVVQEIYGWLLGHYAVRTLMLQAAEIKGISPLRLGFTGSLNVIKRSVTNFQGLKPEQLPFF